MKILRNYVWMNYHTVHFENLSSANLPILGRGFRQESLPLPKGINLSNHTMQTPRLTKPIRTDQPNVDLIASISLHKLPSAGHGKNNSDWPVDSNQWTLCVTLYFEALNEWWGTPPHSHKPKEQPATPVKVIIINGNS